MAVKEISRAVNASGLKTFGALEYDDDLYETKEQQIRMGIGKFVSDLYRTDNGNVLALIESLVERQGTSATLGGV